MYPAAGIYALRGSPALAVSTGRAVGLENRLGPRKKQFRVRFVAGDLTCPNCSRRKLQIVEMMQAVKNLGTPGRRPRTLRHRHPPPRGRSRG